MLPHILSSFSRLLERKGFSYTYLSKEYCCGNLLYRPAVKAHDDRAMAECRGLSKEFVSNNKNKVLFRIKPDFLIKRDDQLLVIADAKWKIIEKDNAFSQSDFYQLFAYAKIFKPKKPLRLYYPMSEYFTKCKRYRYNDNETKITVIPLDMNNV